MKMLIEILKSRNETLYYFGLICLLTALICLVCAKIFPVQVLGTNALYKPFKFLLSSTIFVWTMAWFSGYLTPSPALNWYSWGMVVLLSIENIYILLQVSRGLTSHFNTSTPFHQFMWGIMGAAAVGISLWTALIGSAFFTRSFPALPDHYVWGIRLGLLIFVVFSMQGLLMGARMAHSVGGADGSDGLPVVNWSKTYGDLRIAHFLGMHALQLLPLIAHYLIRQTKGIILVGILYFLITSFVLFQALIGKSVTSMFR